MRRLVHHQASGVGLVRVPTPEVIRAVNGVQQPMEVNGQHIPDDSARQEVLYLRAMRRVAIVKRHDDLAAGLDDVQEDRLVHRIGIDCEEALSHQAVWSPAGCQGLC